MKRQLLKLVLAMSCAVAGMPVQAQAVQQASPAPLTAEQEKRLEPVAPELRPIARRFISAPSRGPMTVESILASRKNKAPDPRPQWLTDVPVTEQMVPVPGGPAVKVFVINAKPGTSRGGILHTHGGGYVQGSALSDVKRLQGIAKELDCVIVTVEYRLAPETTYKGSIEDNYAGLRWMVNNAQALGLDRSRVAVMGESAGGGHAALLAITARDRKEIPIKFQLLVYPMLDDRTGTTVTPPPHIATVGWSAGDNRTGWRAFLGEAPGGAGVPAAGVPTRTANLAGLPPAFIQVGGIDLFVSEDLEFSRRLIEAGVPTEVQVIPGGFHGFEGAGAGTPQSKQFLDARMAALRRALAAPAN